MALAHAAGGLQRLWQSLEGQGGNLPTPWCSSCAVTEYLLKGVSDRVFAEGSHRVFWNCGEIQAEVSSDSSLASRTAKGQGWNGGRFPAGVISRRTKKEQTKFDLWMV